VDRGGADNANDRDRILAACPNRVIEVAPENIVYSEGLSLMSNTHYNHCSLTSDVPQLLGNLKNDASAITLGLLIKTMPRLYDGSQCRILTRSSQLISSFDVVFCFEIFASKYRKI
jgi:hypothetical protein